MLKRIVCAVAVCAMICVSEMTMKNNETVHAWKFQVNNQYTYPYINYPSVITRSSGTRAYGYTRNRVDIGTEYHVYAIQYFLNESMKLNLDIDGNIGAKTDAAIRSYQRKKGLDVDGIVGKDTYRYLMKDNNIFSYEMKSGWCWPTYVNGSGTANNFVKTPVNYRY